MWSAMQRDIGSRASYTMLPMTSSTYRRKNMWEGRMTALWKWQKSLTVGGTGVHSMSIVKWQRWVLRGIPLGHLAPVAGRCQSI